MPEQECKRCAQVAKVQQMSAMRSRLERDFLDSLPGKSVLQLREHLTAKLAALREQTAALLSEPAPEQVTGIQCIRFPIHCPLTQVYNLLRFMLAGWVGGCQWTRHILA